MSKRPRGIRKALKLIRRGKVHHHPARRMSPSYFTVDGRQFHPRQKPYLWAVANGHATTDGSAVSLTKQGRKLLDALSLD